MHISYKSTNQILKATYQRINRSALQVVKPKQNFSIQSNFGYFNLNKKLNNNSSLVYINHRYFSLPSHVKLEMPSLSPTMEKGKISKWNKKEGDQIQPGDILAEIETDKATVDFEMQEEGYLAKILFPEGQKDVSLGTPIAILVDNKEDVAKFKDYKTDQAEAQPQQKQQQQQKEKEAVQAPSSSQASQQQDLPSHITLEMPNLSPTMEKGKIQKWTKQVGDQIKPGDILANIETDKASVDFEMQEEGYLAKLLYPEGTGDIALGQPIAIIVDNKEDIPKFKDYQPGSQQKTQSQAAAPQQQTKQPQAAEPAFQSKSSASSGDRVFASPLAKKTAQEMGVDLSQVQGSGPRSRILKADVEESAKSQPQQQQAKKQTLGSPAQMGIESASETLQYEDIENNNIRKIIAERLQQSKSTIPHYYVTIQVGVDNLIKLRAKLNNVSKTKISVNDMIIKAASMACIKVPETNSTWMGDFVRRYKNVNMSIAVQTDYGLMAPVIFNTNLKGLEEIAQEVKEVANRARNNKLKTTELSGGTFTLSNMGMMGVHNFSAIINPPQACILAVSSAEKRVVVDENAPKDQPNPYKISHLMNVTLSSDHRVVDGAVAAQWGQEFKKLIENPEFMLL